MSMLCENCRQTVFSRLMKQLNEELTEKDGLPKNPRWRKIWIRDWLAFLENMVYLNFISEDDCAELAKVVMSLETTLPVFELSYPKTSSAAD